MIESFDCTRRALGWIKRLTSPVFFSTGEDGVTRQGLQGVPHRRPMLFVGNHQTYALDIGPLVAKLIEDRGIFPRGLAHPAIWAVSIFHASACRGVTTEEIMQSFSRGKQCPCASKREGRGGGCCKDVHLPSGKTAWLHPINHIGSSCSLLTHGAKPMHIKESKQDAKLRSVSVCRAAANTARGAGSCKGAGW